MENIPAWKSSRIDLLARLYDLIHVIPPMVMKPERQNSHIVRMNLPQARGKRFGVRARDSQECNRADGAVAVHDSVNLESGGGNACLEDGFILDAEEDPARRSSLGTGPGASSCCCCRRHQPKEPPERHHRRLPELLQIGSRTPVHGTRIQQIGSSKTCVLGVLPCGYVLGGTGSIKLLSRKRA